MRRSDDDRRQALGAVRVESVRVESVAGDSPVEAAVPFWITACVLLMPPRRRNGEEISATLANAVFPVVQALIADRLRTDPDAAAPLDRDRIARRAGLSSGKKAGWVFDYLELVGGLRVHRHYPEPGRGREADTFTVFTRPPLNYIGPRTHAELEHALDHPDRLLAGHLFLDPDAGQPQGSGSGTFSSRESFALSPRGERAKERSSPCRAGRRSRPPRAPTPPARTHTVDSASAARSRY